MKTISSLIVLLTASFVSAGLTHAAEDVSPIPTVSEVWRFEVTPYIWAPGIRGTLGLDSGLAKSASFNSSDVVSNL
ncbi:MAG: hypothetical protein RLY75_1448, partial [Pseudomonadota bacterium]